MEWLVASSCRPIVDHHSRCRVPFWKKKRRKKSNMTTTCQKVFHSLRRKTLKKCEKKSSTLLTQDIFFSFNFPFMREERGGRSVFFSFFSSRLLLYYYQQLLIILYLYKNVVFLRFWNRTWQILKETRGVKKGGGCYVRLCAACLSPDEMEMKRRFL